MYLSIVGAIMFSRIDQMTPLLTLALFGEEDAIADSFSFAAMRSALFFVAFIKSATGKTATPPIGFCNRNLKQILKLNSNLLRY